MGECFSILISQRSKETLQDGDDFNFCRWNDNRWSRTIFCYSLFRQGESVLLFALLVVLTEEWIYLRDISS